MLFEGFERHCELLELADFSYAAVYNWKVRNFATDAMGDITKQPILNEYLNELSAMPIGFQHNLANIGPEHDAFDFLDPWARLDNRSKRLLYALYLILPGYALIFNAQIFGKDHLFKGDIRQTMAVPQIEEADEAGLEEGTMLFSLRDRLPVLVHGRYLPLLTDNTPVIAVARFVQGQTVVCVLNLQPQGLSAKIDLRSVNSLIYTTKDSRRKEKSCGLQCSSLEQSVSVESLTGADAVTIEKVETEPASGIVQYVTVAIKAKSAGIIHIGQAVEYQSRPKHEQVDGGEMKLRGIKRGELCRKVKLRGLKPAASSRAENNLHSSLWLKLGDFCEGLKLVANLKYAHKMKEGKRYCGSGLPGLRYLPWLVGRELFRHPEPFYSDGGNVPADIQKLMRMARKHYNNKEYGLSAEYNRQIAKIDLARGYIKEAAKALSMSAHDYSACGNAILAARYNEISADLFEQIGDLKSAENSLYKAGRDYYGSGDYEKAAICNERAAYIDSINKDALKEIKLLYFAGRDWKEAGNHIASAHAFEKCANVCLGLGDLKAAAAMLAFAADGFYRAGEYLRSAECSYRLAELDERLNLHDMKIRALDMAAHAYRRGGAFIKAAHAFEKLADINRMAGTLAGRQEYVRYSVLAADEYEHAGEFALARARRQALEHAFEEKENGTNADGGINGYSWRIPGCIPIDIHISMLGFLLFAFVPYAIIPFALLYVSATIHELTHAVFARAYGMKLNAIKFNALSAFIELEGIFQTPRQEFIIALVGPLANIILGLGALVACGICAIPVDYLQIFTLGINILSLTPLELFAVLNLLIAATNLLFVVYPTDGARLLRSTLASSLGVRRANDIQDYLNHGLGALLGLAPLALLSFDMAAFKQGFIFGMGMLGLSSIYVSRILLMDHDYRIQNPADLNYYVRETTA